MSTYTQILQLTSAGYNSGPFNVYYNTVAQGNKIAGNISAATLLGGVSIQVPTQSYAVILVDESPYCGNQSQTFSVIPYTPAPTSAPTTAPTSAPTGAPTAAPTTAAPTVTPAPTTAPTTAAPTTAPTTASPTAAPTTATPTAAPTTIAPTPSPTTPAPTPTYTAYSVYYGATASAACAKTNLVTLYWVSPGNWGDDLEYFTDPALTTHANGYYTNGAGYYYRIDSTGFIVNWGTPGVPAACPAPTPSPTTPAPSITLTFLFNAIAGNNFTNVCAGSGTTYPVYGAPGNSDTGFVNGHTYYLSSGNKLNYNSAATYWTDPVNVGSTYFTVNTSGVASTGGTCP